MTVEKMSAISTAGAGLLTWLLAILHYCSVSKKVTPKRKAVEMAQKQQKQNQKDLDNIKAEVQVTIFFQLTLSLIKISSIFHVLWIWCSCLIVYSKLQSLTEEMAKLSEQYNQGIAQQKELQEQGKFST